MMTYWKVQVQNQVFVCENWRTDASGRHYDLSGVIGLEPITGISLTLPREVPIAFVETNEKPNRGEDKQ